MKETRLILLAILLATGAQAAMWQVEKDGSGDFTIIQEAVNASASGDTILIGPGRYDDTVTYTNPYISWTVCVVIPGSDLTFIGAGPDDTIIGPAAPGDMTQNGWRGMISSSLYTGDIFIHDIGFEHVYEACYLTPEVLTVYNCKISECVYGISVFGNASTLVDNCGFHDIQKGVNLHDCTGPIVQNCVFENSILQPTMAGVYMANVSSYNIYNSSFSVAYIGCFVSTGTISNCSFDNSYTRSMLLSSGNCRIENNVSDGSQHNWCIITQDAAEISGSGNVLKNASWSALRLVGSQVAFNGNHILPIGEYINANGYTSPPALELDFRNNYWGTSDPAELSARIVDGYDDPNEYVNVRYEPFSSNPMSNEERSWGEIKALYKQ